MFPEIRQMQLDDIAMVYRLGKTAFFEEQDVGYSYAYNYWSLTQVAQIAEEYIDLAYVAVDEEKLVGFVLGHPTYQNIVDVGYLEWIAIDKSYRQLGIAQALISQILKAFKFRDIQRVVADITGSNQGSMNLFKKKFGFQEKENIVFLEKEFKYGP